jgi:hypothetical protein
MATPDLQRAFQPSGSNVRCDLPTISASNLRFYTENGLYLQIISGSIEINNAGIKQYLA